MNNVDLQHIMQQIMLVVESTLCSQVFFFFFTLGNFNIFANNQTFISDDIEHPSGKALGCRLYGLDLILGGGGVEIFPHSMSRLVVGSTQSPVK